MPVNNSHEKLLSKTENRFVGNFVETLGLPVDKDYEEVFDKGEHKPITSRLPRYCVLPAFNCASG
jgi:hypothetical protein